MDYKFNVKGVVNTYQAFMFMLYVERQKVTSYCCAFIDARSNNVRTKDHFDPVVHRITLETVTASDVTHTWVFMKLKL